MWMGENLIIQKNGMKMKEWCSEVRTTKKKYVLRMANYPDSFMSNYEIIV